MGVIAGKLAEEYERQGYEVVRDWPDMMLIDSNGSVKFVTLANGVRALEVLAPLGEVIHVLPEQVREAALARRQELAADARALRIELDPRVCAMDGCTGRVTGRVDQKFCSTLCRVRNARAQAASA